MRQAPSPGEATESQIPSGSFYIAGMLILASLTIGLSLGFMREGAGSLSLPPSYRAQSTETAAPHQ
jgi:hypothetical protein